MPLVPPPSAPPPRFDTRTGRPVAPGGLLPTTVAPGAGPTTVRPLRPSTFLRDLILLILHLIVYVVIIGGVGYQVRFIGPEYGLAYAGFDAIFWPSFAWGTLIAAQAGTVFFQRRRFLGAVLGAMGSVLVGSWILGHIDDYRVVAVVFRSVAVAVVALAIAVSLLRRPPAIVIGGAVTPSVPPAVGVPTIAVRRPSGFVSIPNLVLGMFAVLFVLSAIVAGTFRALEVRGSGDAGQSSQRLPPFTGISATGVGRLIILPGPQTSLTVTGDANLLDYVDSKIVEGELRLTFDPGASGAVRLEQPLVYQVTLPSLASLSIGGQIEASIEPGADRGSLRVVVGDDARLVASGLALDALSVAVRDDGRVDLGGRTGSITIDASGASSLDAMDLTVGGAEVALSESSSVDLGETGTLRYRQSGSATLQCADGTETLGGSVYLVPQCGVPPSRTPMGAPSEPRGP